MTDEAVEAVARAIAAERNKTLHGVRGAGHDWCNHIDEAHAAITAYEANRTDVEELREALKPLGYKADFYDLHAEVWGKQHHDGFTVGISLGTCRRVRDLLTRISSLEKKGS